MGLGAMSPAWSETPLPPWTYLGPLSEEYLRGTCHMSVEALDIKDQRWPHNPLEKSRTILTKQGQHAFA